MTNITNQTGDATSAAGRPDLGKLAQMGVIRIGADGWPEGSAKNPVIGEKTITVRIEGVKTLKKIPINGGHAKNPLFPLWRAGLNPEKYHAIVMKEAEVQAAKGKKNIKVAPDLMPEEAEDYLRWLDEQNIEKPDNSVLQPIEDAKKEVLARKIDEAKKVSKKPGRPAKTENNA